MDFQPVESGGEENGYKQDSEGGGELFHLEVSCFDFAAVGAA